MGGTHEPPSNRSFYFSVAASTLRFAIIAALVVGGIVVIDQAFPDPAESGGNGAAPIDPGPVVTDSPSPSASPSKSPKPAPSPTIVGVRIAVFNGAGVSGLAGDTQNELVDSYGYVAAQEPLDAPAPVPVTTIYYRSNADQVEAEFLAADFFGDLEDVAVTKLDPDTEDVGRDVQLAIYLGNDYATSVG